MTWGQYYSPPSKPTPAAGVPAVPLRAKLPNGLYVWDPARDESPYWALQLPTSSAQAEYNRRALDAPLRKDDR